MSTPPPPSNASLPAREVYTVARLVLEARALLERGFPLLWLEGEVSNFTAAGSGHLYFTLKDAFTQVRCAMFRSRAALLAVRPRNGEHVLVRCRPTVYEGRGEFQLQVESLEPAGTGAALRAREARRRMLAAEGLFDVARKRPLPPFPRRIALITSPRGAAVHDMLSTLRRRWPALEVTVLPVLVQGEAAAQAIVAAIAAAQSYGQVLVLARGGGANEDLAAFDDEAVVRALARSALPTVTGVGHEVDYTLVDWVADLRAPTPTAAAELIVPDQFEWLRRLLALHHQGAAAMERRLAHPARHLQHLRARLRHPAQRLGELGLACARARERASAATGRALARRRLVLAQVCGRLAAHSPQQALAAQRVAVEMLVVRLAGGMSARMAQDRSALSALAAQLHALSPLATLGRGYALARAADSGALLRDSAAAPPGTAIRVQLARGALNCLVTESNADASA